MGFPAHDLHLSPQCSICGTALSGPLSVPFRALGIKRSPRNPNLCSRCAAHVEEGRVVEITVIFADLSSFTELTQELGAERTHEVVDAYLRMATAILVKHGAFIDKYLGDAVMALFNIPIRHVDHARRAVAAASELHSGLNTLRERFGMDLQISVGIATGWARVGRLGSEDSKDYTAIGDVVNLAARLQGKAGAGEIVVSHETYERISTDFPDATTEIITLKGFKEPVEAHRLSSKTGIPLSGDPVEKGTKQSISLGAVIFGILGAPCAVAVLISPLAVALGAGTLFGLAGVLVLFDRSLIRIPILVLAALGALANLYTVWRARELRLQAIAEGNEQLGFVSTQERRRAVFVVASAVAVLVLIVSEFFAHRFMHQG
ncbi:MAG: adenylate/guanylate cyclase domain-containing protein [Deltaproteobacteria bacterium]|nr:adenylate/guanylate cyclase domain-containing protein [Deltaproteobacteria bacterium]